MVTVGSIELSMTASCSNAHQPRLGALIHGCAKSGSWRGESDFVTWDGEEFRLPGVCRGLMAHLSAITGLRVCRPRACAELHATYCHVNVLRGLPHSKEPAEARYRAGWHLGVVSAISRQDPRWQGLRDGVTSADAEAHASAHSFAR